MKLYSVYVSNWAISRNSRQAEKAVWVARFHASSRLGALVKALPEIRKVVLPAADPTIVYVSVHVGETKNPSAFASRLHPFQVNRATGAARVNGQDCSDATLAQLLMREERDR